MVLVLWGCIIDKVQYNNNLNKNYYYYFINILIFYKDWRAAAKNNGIVLHISPSLKYFPDQKYRKIK